MVDEKWWILPRFTKGKKIAARVFLFLFLPSQELARLVPLNWTYENLHLYRFLVESNIDSLCSSKDWNRRMNVVTTLTLIWSLSAKNFRLMNFKEGKKRWRVIKKSRNTKFIPFLPSASVFFKWTSWINRYLACP